MRPSWIPLLSVFCARVAFAVPGPDSVAVVANVNDPESVALAELYMQARSIPQNQLCLLDLPAEHTIGLSDYLDRFEAPFEACLSDAGVMTRIEAVVLMKGVPLRVTIDAEGSSARASLAATLGVWKSTTSTGARMLERLPGLLGNCGQNTCLAARWTNPFTTGAFEPGFTASRQGIDYRLLLVTALTGRSYADAAQLIESATTADALGGALGDFVFMDGADAARGVLDSSYDLMISRLMDRGFTQVERVPFERDWTGRSLAAFFVGTAGLGDTIEGNEYLPGALVDNLTSFGAVPPNFEAPEDEVQVSIARWIAKGVTGVHGTTDEPLNNCFPSRNLIVDYVDGWTLAESYHRNMPFVYWRNLVIGDPMVAPYAERPTVLLTGVEDGEVVDGAAMIHVRLMFEPGNAIDAITLYVNGEELIKERAAGLDTCLVFDEEGEYQILAVAQFSSGVKAKGWSAVTVRAQPGRPSCDAPVDAGIPELGLTDLGVANEDTGAVVDLGQVDAGRPDMGMPSMDEGCACRARSAKGVSLEGGLWLLVLFWGRAVFRRRRIPV